MAERKAGRVEQVALATKNLQIIFERSRILDLAVLVLENFMILRESDLEAWNEDPEEWILGVTGEIVTGEAGLRVHCYQYFAKISLPERPYSWSLSLNTRRI